MRYYILLEEKVNKDTGGSKARVSTLSILIFDMFAEENVCITKKKTQSIKVK